MGKVFKWIGIVVVGFIVLGVISSMLGGGKTSETSGTTTSGGVMLKEGSTISGVSREEVDKKYNEALKASKFKADEYLTTVKGQDVEWVVKVQNVDTKIDGVVYLSAKSGIYTTWINDPAKKYTSFAKDDVVKVKGKITNVVNLIGLTVELDPESVTKI